jgi:sRNA-binding regulator protein Hfq
LVEATNRKLIRPSLHDVKDKMSERKPSSGPPPKKSAPPEQTNAENFYYAKQVSTRTPMVLVLKDGEEVHGVIEWYDKCAIRLLREEAPGLMIYKPSIKYMYKAGERR